MLNLQLVSSISLTMLIKRWHYIKNTIPVTSMSLPCVVCFALFYIAYHDSPQVTQMGKGIAPFSIALNLALLGGLMGLTIILYALVFVNKKHSAQQAKDEGNNESHH